MPTPNPLAPVKGAGTTLWLYTGTGNAFANPLSDIDWNRLAKIKELTPGEMTAESYDDTYLDDEDADWNATAQGAKSAGDTSFTLAWKPGEEGQKDLVAWFIDGSVRYYKIKYPNGTVDVFRGWCSSLGKAIPAKEVITRTAKITNTGKPELAEESGTPNIPVTGVTLDKATASVAVGATTTLNVTVNPASASDTSFRVATSDGAKATVTVSGNAITVTVTIPGIGKLAQKGSNGAVTVADGGTGANTASGARTKLGLGSAATQNVGLDAGDVMGVGGFGIGRPNGVIRVNNINNVTDLANSLREYGLVPFRSEKNIPGTWGIYNYAPSLFLQTVDTLAILSLPFNAESPVRILGGGSEGIKTARTLWDDINTTVDSNGFIKRASPVVKIYADGTAEMNDESEGCKVSRISAGNYLISGCNGLNADAAWGGIDGGFEIPLDKNKQARIWLDYEVNPDGSVLVKTCHRTHPDAPEFARNLIGVRNDDGTFTETTKNGYPIDIPADSFVSVRVEMPEDSIWNQKKEETREAFEKAEYKRQQNQQDAQE